MTSINEINSISIHSVLDTLWIQYNWNAIIQDWSITDWWKINKNKNYVHDFSHQRGSWGPFAFVKSYLWLSSKETFEWFEENFGISNEYENYSSWYRRVNTKWLRLKKFYN